VDKPAGITSHDVVAACRRQLNERKVGHAGTLDPGATGVLLVGVGHATRLLRFLSGADKTYTAEVVFGVETSTLDADGELTATYAMEVTPAAVQDAVDRHLFGSIEQVPPMVSAIKVGGRRLYELAREGVEIERAPRVVTVHRFTTEPTDDPLVYRIAVTCSSGTYVRTLAADLGHLLGGGAHLRQLRRRSVGSFTEADARPLDALALLPIEAAVRDLPLVTVDASTAVRIGHGAVLDAPAGPGPWAMFDDEGRLLAVYEAHGVAAAKPAVVVVAG
jgi:tRNA pseudouridine55 synthase